MIYPLKALRSLALEAQGLATRNGSEPAPTLENIYRLVEQLGCVQIDTLQRVKRSQYLVLWSRLGQYDPADLDRLIYDPQKQRLFEYWKHAASILPLNEYRYCLPMMERFRSGDDNWFGDWLQDPENHVLIEQVLERVRLEGPLRAANFERDGHPAGSWWNWKPAKRALEHLYDRGDLMIRDRVNFQRVYDLRERVLPEWVDTRPASREERDRFRLEQAVYALGVTLPIQAAEYAYLKRGTAKPALEALIQDEVLQLVQGQTADGQTVELVIHRNRLEDLERATQGGIQPERTTFLSPFDSLFWARGRDELFWNFRNVLEAYKPGPARIWGYFCLPILHHDRFVGRFDPKLERREGRLRLEALYLEPGVTPDDELVSDVAAALRDFMGFHRATELVVERSEPAEFGEKLLRVI
jgi:uncharacterized protein YcaQ